MTVFVILDQNGELIARYFDSRAHAVCWLNENMDQLFNSPKAEKDYVNDTMVSINEACDENFTFEDRGNWSDLASEIWYDCLTEDLDIIELEKGEL